MSRSRPPSWSAPQWQIDPLDVSGHASDSNAGSSRSAPLASFAELLARMGTEEPYLNGVSAVNVNFMSGHVDTSDPILFAPRIAPGVQYSLTCDLPAGGLTGTLSGVVANSISGNQALSANLPAGTQPGSLIVNASQGGPSGSIARAYSNVSGNLWLITQPVVPMSPTSITVGQPVQVNTWTNGDAVTVYPPASNAPSNLNLYNLYVQKHSPRVLGANGTFNNPPLVQNVNFADLNTLSSGLLGMIEIGAGQLFCGSSSSILLKLDEWMSLVSNTRFMGHDFGVTGAVTGGNPGILAAIQACSWRAHAGWYPQGGWFDCGTIIIGNESLNDQIAASSLGVVYVDGAGSGRSLNLCSVVGPFVSMFTTYNGGQPAIYGSGGVDARACVMYTGTAASSFPCAGGLKIRGKSTAYAPSTSGGTTTWKQLALSAAALDLAAPSGFGGYATFPGVGSFWNGAAQP